MIGGRSHSHHHFHFVSLSLRILLLLFYYRNDTYYALVLILSPLSTPARQITRMLCPNCASSNLHFNDDALCLLCSDCGNVIESNQSVLDFSMTTEKGTGTNFGMGRALYNQSSTLVARSGRYLNSDTREARWNRNLVSYSPAHYNSK